MLRSTLFYELVAVLLGYEVLAQTDVCQSIEAAISNASSVYYPGTENYTHDIWHWSQLATQPSNCSVEPGTAEDVGTILQILDTTRTPFAVKGVGHATNPGFSDTPGVQIAMYRFSDIDYDSAAETVTIGAGLSWDEVYAALDPFGVNVVGARVPGPGVAGLSLGGGLSWFTNQYGLTLDTIVAMELVQPNGTVANITQEFDPDLFFALKGTQNNFGIVTKIVFHAFSQGQVWGGPISYGADKMAAVNAATLRFHEITDPRAELMMTYSFMNGELNPIAMVFYDAPTVPPGIFDDFLGIPAVSNNASTRSFKDHVASFGGGFQSGLRTVFHSVSLLNHSQPVVDAVANETAFWASRFAAETSGPLIVQYYLESFLPAVLSINPEPTAYPPSRETTFFPLCLFYAWSSSDMDTYFLDSIRASAKQITAVAIEDGQAIENVALYPNYVLYDTPSSRIYGDNMGRLEAIKARVDPHDVMGLAGGFKI